MRNNDGIGQKIKKLYYQVKTAVLTVFGDIKIFKWPMFVVYDASSFRIKGDDTRKIIEILKPGDVVMRAYRSYLDGYFIPTGESRCSHSGLYVGNGQIIHSIAEGCQKDDIIDYCRADRIMILRPRRWQRRAIIHAERCASENTPYDFDFEPDAGKYYCHEFTASCYPRFKIQPLSRKVFGFLPSPVVYLADSFLTNPNFTMVFESDGQKRPWIRPCKKQKRKK